MGRTNKKDLSMAISQELQKGFNIDNFKVNKGLSSNVKFKEERWIPFSPALQETLSIPGCPMGHIMMVRGGSNTGKSTTAIELCVSAQKMGILPVIIMTEMKHDWTHWRTMGFEMEDVADEETGEIIDHKGFFIYRDRSNINSIEDISSFILDLENEQAKGNLPYDLFFMWDSVGSIPCDMSIEKANNNPMWNAGAIASQFGNFVNSKIVSSRKESSKYTNTLFIVNKTGVSPAETARSFPKMTNKGGTTFYYDASLCITFGNITNAGITKIEAQNNNKKVHYATRTKVSCDKNHVNGIETRGTVINTIHGFIDDTPNALTKYKKAHSPEWKAILGQGEYVTIEDTSDWDEKSPDQVIED